VVDAKLTDAELVDRLKAIASEAFPSANRFAVAENVKNLIRILERVEPSEYALIHRSMYPSRSAHDDGQPTEMQEWHDYDADC